MAVLAICALILIVVSSTLGQREDCILPGNINGRYVGKQPGDMLEHAHSVEVQCDQGTTDHVNGRLRCMFRSFNRRLPFCPRHCKLEAGDSLLVGTNFRQSAPLVLHHQYSVTLQCQEGYGSTVPLLSVFCEDGTLTQPRDLAFCTKEHDCSKADQSAINTIVKSGLKMKAYCQVDETGKWTVIQKRLDGSVNFTRNWEDYKQGFGNVAGEFWLGNDNIHALTAAGLTKLRIDVEDWDNAKYTVYYDTFLVAGAQNKYQLTISGFSGSYPPGDSMTHHDGMQFTTYNQDNDLDPDNCASKYGGGGWWYRACHWANLNGDYNNTVWRKGINWSTWPGRGGYYSLKKSAMMIRNP